MGFLSLFSSAVSLMPDVVKVLDSLKGLLPSAPTAAAQQVMNGGAEVGLAKVIQDAMPDVTPGALSSMFHKFGLAVAIFKTENPNASLDDPANVAAIEKMALGSI